MRILHADITTLNVDAIVNPANPYLMGGGRVDAAIHRAAGPELLAACKGIGGCAAGDVGVTPSFELPAQWVFHSIGPRWQGGPKNEPELRASRYKCITELAVQYQVRSIAIPRISCGIYRYQPHQAAVVAIGTIEASLAASRVEPVTFAILDTEVTNTYQTALETWERRPRTG